MSRLLQSGIQRWTHVRAYSVSGLIPYLILSFPMLSP